MRHFFKEKIRWKDITAYQIIGYLDSRPLYLDQICRIMVNDHGYPGRQYCTITINSDDGREFLKADSIQEAKELVQQYVYEHPELFSRR